DGARVKCAVFKGGFAFHAEKDAQVFAGECDEFVVRERGQFGIAFAADVRGEGEVAGGRAIWEKRGGKNRAENFEPLDFGNEHSKALAGVGNVFAAKAQDEAGNGWITDFAETVERQLFARFDL